MTFEEYEKATPEDLRTEAKRWFEMAKRPQFMGDSSSVTSLLEAQLYMHELDWCENAGEHKHSRRTEWRDLALEIVVILMTGAEIVLASKQGEELLKAEATMLMHTRGILVMTAKGAMVLTGKRASIFPAASQRKITTESAATTASWDRTDLRSITRATSMTPARSCCATTGTLRSWPASVSRGKQSPPFLRSRCAPVPAPVRPDPAKKLVPAGWRLASNYSAGQSSTLPDSVGRRRNSAA